jgi:hypothetical protein
MTNKSEGHECALRDDTLSALLDLDREIFLFDEGYRVNFVARRVIPNPHMPYGIKYSLTFHDRANNRIVGFDNSHAIKTKGRKKFGVCYDPYDHWHLYEKVFRYDYQSAGKLLEDFWKQVNKIKPIW